MCVNFTMVIIASLFILIVHNCNKAPASGKITIVDEVIVLHAADICCSCQSKWLFFLLVVKLVLLVGEVLNKD